MQSVLAASHFSAAIYTQPSASQSAQSFNSWSSLGLELPSVISGNVYSMFFVNSTGTGWIWRIRRISWLFKLLNNLGIIFSKFNEVKVLFNDTALITITKYFNLQQLSYNASVLWKQKAYAISIVETCDRLFEVHFHINNSFWLTQLRQAN